MIVWVGGELVDEREARISPFDHGLLVGDGVFETIRVYAGQPFAWTRHLRRLRGSAAALGLAVPDPEALRAAADGVVEANDLPDGRLRITVTGGPGPPGSARGHGPPTLIVTASPLETAEPTIDTAVAPWRRNERGALVGVKSTSYADNVRALAWAATRGADEAVFANTRGNLCEGTGTNVFLVEGDVVVTPPGSAGCLAGVTRGLVLELAGAAGIPAVEQDRPSAALAEADEAFLTSTTREVQPIARVDGRALPAAPGPVTGKLAAAFRDLVGRNPDP